MTRSTRSHNLSDMRAIAFLFVLLVGCGASAVMSDDREPADAAVGGDGMVGDAADADPLDADPLDADLDSNLSDDLGDVDAGGSSDLGMDAPALSCMGALYNAVTGKCYATVIVGTAGTQCADIGMEEAWWTTATEQSAIETDVLAALGVSSGASTALYYSFASSSFVWWMHETVTPAVTWAVAPRGTDRFAYLRTDGMHGSSTNPRTPVLCQTDPR